MAGGEGAEVELPRGIEAPKLREDVAILPRRVAAAFGDLLAVGTVIVDGPEHLDVGLEFLGQHRGSEAEALEFPLCAADGFRTRGEVGEGVAILGVQ